jgi:holin-like protein
LIRGFAALLLCQLAGEIAARGLSLPVPGPVLGLGLLVCGLAVARRRGVPDPDRGEVGRVADGLVANLALLFVPAGVGVVQYLDLIERYGLVLGLAVGGSTLLTLLATVGTFLLAKRWAVAGEEPGRP